ncbi:exodeoxyribonuclease III [Blochmannia endosymbiont of Camponotus sp. C-003]|uniref:exodeoxyribonuclease III n=1 Tax=unclassified Candidatus Blochmanniella TaxID=711328 RepID=UPI0020244EFE|nr:MULTISPECIES: exodeoxyribonuclease III [unclassified Candidatus Blochmannia]URJ23390.1 exodeoxyribonuclease III [Blochmannia endosymbiont of Camponotus sp. C-003]URJ28862.1 exodeoxyribonuclease III [Blochmannia endosymbiont of Camponotus sp. C-046]
MKFVSFNINGLRARMHQLNTIILKLQPDVIGLQETKVHDDFFPIKEILKYDYHVYYYGQKKHYGVALFLRQLPLTVIHGLTNDNDLSQKRIIMANIKTSIGILTIINGYFPQGENKNHPEKFAYKKNFYKSFQNYIERTYQDHSLLLIMGDMNISPTDFDVGIGEKNKKRWLTTGRCSFLPEERTWINRLMDWGLIDIYRNMHPQNDERYSWFSYRSRGFFKNNGLRIDLILATRPLAVRCRNSDISYSIRGMQRPSDHAPVWVDLDI